MPVYNLSFLDPNLPKKKSYRSITKELQLKEDILAKDGNLSPGDYDVLLRDATKMFSTPGLTSEERDSLELKISGYEKNKSLKNLSDNQDLGRINREYEDSLRTFNTSFDQLSPDAPEQTMKSYLTAKAKLDQYKIERLSETIDDLNASGDDITKHAEELSKMQNEIEMTAEALDIIDNPTLGTNSSLRLNLETNDRGKITDIRLSRGAKSGFQDIKATVAGIPIAGNPVKRGGKVFYNLAGTEFSAPEFPDPMNPYAKGTLTASGSDETNFTEIDQTQIKPQGFLPDDAWTKTDDGKLYQKRSDGYYDKYVGSRAIVKEKELKDSGSVIYKLPNSYLDSINSRSFETFDDPISGPVISGGISTSSPVSTQSTSTQPQISTLGMGQSKTPQPKERSPQTSSGVAGNLIDKAKGFFGSLFGK